MSIFGEQELRPGAIRRGSLPLLVEVALGGRVGGINLVEVAHVTVGPGAPLSGELLVEVGARQGRRGVDLVDVAKGRLAQRGPRTDAVARSRRRRIAP